MGVMIAIRHEDDDQGRPPERPCWRLRAASMPGRQRDGWAAARAQGDDTAALIGALVPSARSSQARCQPCLREAS